MRMALWEGSSTASISSSILEYRRFKGRTYHSDRDPTEYFTPNDDQQSESIDINHHALTLLLGGKLFIAPISDNVLVRHDKMHRRESCSTDFADQYPNAEFEIDDTTLTWSWKDNTVDFVHIRYLFGATRDWAGLFKEACRCTAPSSWIQTAEADVEILSDDGTTDSEPVLKTWAQPYRDGGKALGSTFYVQKEDLQEKGLEAAGFTDIKSVNYMWPKDDCQMFLMSFRKYLRNRKVHGYMAVRYVYARKPEAPQQEES
ncbi:hypothetical protein EDB80DRAFT_756530 [Ilyonectria destructans]|nr:hypothetical protein EDB80DRAFT_756530 [Ilyonectria destructans]